MQRKFQFYIVPTPIGNLDDITLRALEVLKNVDIIACEDSRVTQSLLNKFKINKKLISYHKYNEKSRVEEFLNYINSGKTIALVSDAGTPMICDPGNVLISELRKNNVTITALAGACAIPALLSQLPRDTETFVFVGFFPKTEQKSKELLWEFSKYNMVFYESPNRIIDTLKLIQKVRGDIKVALARELTKLYEETVIDNVSNIIEKYKNGIKGEIICMVYSSSSDSIDVNITQKVNLLRDKGYKSKDISVILLTLYNLNKNDIYKLTMSE